MKISHSFEKFVFYARTKAEVTELVKTECNCSFRSGTRIVNNRKVAFSCLVDNRDRASYFYLINYEKHRDKFYRNKADKDNSFKVKNGYWVAFVYIVPVESVVGAFQHLRNFHIAI